MNYVEIIWTIVQNPAFPPRLKNIRQKCGPETQNEILHLSPHHPLYRPLPLLLSCSHSRIKLSSEVMLHQKAAGSFEIMLPFE